VQFLKTNRPFRSSAAFNAGLENKCVDWLAKHMRRNPEGPPDGRVKKDYQQEAQAKFGLKARAFQRAWKEAINQTGAIGWSKGGRPKTSHKTKTPAQI
jgi:hypothetical protein